VQPNHCGGNAKPGAAAAGIAQSFIYTVTNTLYAAFLAGSLLLSLFDGFNDGLHAVLLDGWLAGSVFLLLVDGFPSGSRIALLGGWLGRSLTTLAPLGRQSLLAIDRLFHLRPQSYISGWLSKTRSLVPPRFRPRPQPNFRPPSEERAGITRP